MAGGEDIHNIAAAAKVVDDVARRDAADFKVVSGHLAHDGFAGQVVVDTEHRNAPLRGLFQTSGQNLAVAELPHNRIRALRHKVFQHLGIVGGIAAVANVVDNLAA